MCVQFDLEVMCKIPKNEKRPSNFHIFLSKVVPYRRKGPPKKRTLMFKHYDLLNPMEQETIIS